MYDENNNHDNDKQQRQTKLDVCVIVCLELLSHESHSDARRNSAVLRLAGNGGSVWTPASKKSKATEFPSRSAGAVATVSRMGPAEPPSRASESENRPCSSQHHAVLDGSLTVRSRKSGISQSQTPLRAVTSNASQQRLFKRPENVPKQVTESQTFSSEKF